MGWLRDSLETARQTMALLLRSRLVQLLAVGCAVYPAVFRAVAGRAAASVEGDDFFAVVTYMVVFQFGLPVTALYLGVVAVHGDLQDRTSTYLFVRPVRRSALLAGKCVAVIALCWAGAALSTALLYALLTLAPPPWRLGVAPAAAMLGAFAVGALLEAAGLIAVVACFAALFRRPLVFGAAFLVGWEVVVNVAPPDAGVRAVSVLDPVRRWLVAHLPSAGDLRDLPQMRDELWLAPDALADPLWSLARFTAVAAALALWIYSRREYDSRPAD